METNLTREANHILIPLSSPTTIGSTKLAHIKTSKELKSMIDGQINSETVLVKPNFVDRAQGTHTDPESLRMLFEALDSKIIVIEGHQLIRCITEDKPGLCFDHKGKERDWWWIARGGWNYFAEHDDWDWFCDGLHWDRLKELDQVFLDEKGFSDLFNEFGVEYVNVTDEIWAGEVVDPDEVRSSVDERYGSIEPKVYGFMPKKLYKHRDSTLISYSKYKQYPTFTLKNMFGLLPDPIRCWWHGPKNNRFNQSVIDINKLYSTFFNILGIHESLGKTTVNDPDGAISVPEFKYNIHEGLGVVGVGTDRVELDTIMAGLGGYPLSENKYLEMADNILGKYTEKYYTKAAGLNWLPMMKHG